MGPTDDILEIANPVTAKLHTVAIKDLGPDAGLAIGRNAVAEHVVTGPIAGDNEDSRIPFAFERI